MKKEQVKRKKRGNRTKQQDGNAPKAVTPPKDKTVKSPKNISRKSSPTAVNKREGYKKKGETSSFFKIFQGISQFFREARMELKKVKWPTRKELMAVTVMVIILVLVVSIYLGILDYGLIKLIKHLIG